MSGWVPAGSDISDMEEYPQNVGGGPPYRTVGPEPQSTPDQDADVDRYINSWGSDEIGKHAGNSQKRHRDIAIAMIGRRYRFLVVLNFCAPGKFQTVLVQCDCGIKCSKEARKVRRGEASSCGCKRDRHSDCRSAEYRVWAAMIQRCTNPACKSFGNYGGRGITVDASWRSYSVFLRDMGRRPTGRHTLERVNNSSGYCAENCKWATRTEQGQNTRSNTRITIAGITKPLIGWARESGINRATISSRQKVGVTGQALIAPAGPTGRKNGGPDEWRA